jgi:ELWxxDGT repeat protein
VADLLAPGFGGDDAVGGPRQLTPLGDRLLFTLPFQGALWSATGAAAAPIALHPTSHALTALRDVAYFFDTAFESNAYVTELWRTDGTAAGTMKVIDVNRESVPLDYGIPLGPAQVDATAAAGGRLFFHLPAVGPCENCGHPSLPGPHGTLWSSDGTAAGTAPVEGAPCGESVCWALIGSGGSGGSAGRVFFAVHSYLSGAGALWTSDGTATGTLPVWFAAPGTSAGQVAGLGDGRALFTVEDGVDLDQLWVSDGTPEGTALLVDLRPGHGRARPRDWTLVGGRLFFTAEDGAHGRELWSSDGTVDGTRLVADIRLGPQSSFPGHLAEIGGRLVFAADDGVHGLEPWIDGAGGARLLADVLHGPGSSDPLDFARLGEEVCFNAGRPRVGYELWCLSLPSD